MRASIPALQRGLVWSPQKVELLWDSVLRGFPVGCLVVSRGVDEQQRRKDPGVTHHLLDGQQRCNALALGYHDPFANGAGQVRGNISESILWLDLAPMGTARDKIRQLPDSSTREFLVRVTTLAHPWGYSPGDDAAKLSAGEARMTIDFEFGDGPKPSKRPASRELLPWRSNAAVPLSWLMLATGEEGAPKDGAIFWREVTRRLEEVSALKKWPKLALEFMAQPDVADELEKIHRAICRAVQTKIVALVAPDELLMPIRQERRAANPNAGNIANIEHLFNRLNRQGSPLEGEELIYSMIKAYWPEMVDVIKQVKPLRFPASHLVALGIRAALTPPGSSKLARGLGIPRLRTIATAAAPEEGEVATAEFRQRRMIQTFLGIDQGEGIRNSGRLANGCATVDRWLAYQDAGDHGLPPVLVSSFARKSPDFYLVLLLMADGLRDRGQEDPRWGEILPGVATLLHWFAKGDRRPEIADFLWESQSGGVTPENLLAGLSRAFNADLIVLPRHPNDLRTFIDFPNDESISKWRWWQSLIDTGSEEDRARNTREWWSFLEATRREKELLIYAQRQYLMVTFPDYDPSRRDLWESHNRPWDYDHIHANDYISHKQGTYADFCRQWGDCIGNFRALPFEQNRADGKQSALEKLGDDPDAMRDCLILSTAEIAAFSHKHQARHESSKARDLADTIWRRFIRIYESWYGAARIASLLPSRRESETSH